MEPLGGRALFEEVCHWGWALRLYSLSSLPVCSPCPSISCMWRNHGLSASCPFHHAFPTYHYACPIMVDSIALQR